MNALLERLRDRYHAGLLTRGELFEALTELGASVEAVALAFDPSITSGLAKWQAAIRAGATVIGGERD